MKENQAVTHGIANKGFSGMRRVVARFNFTCNLTGNHPQSLTGHTAIRCTQAEKRASRTIGTFGFCLDTKPKAEKPKEPNFSQRSTETRILTERNKRYK
jgi:hypothetical protein